jgi:hypothetical protein
MASFTVRKGRRYRATIALGWVESWADNSAIAERLQAAGFTDVSVTGTGDTRIAEGRWPGPDATAEMPAQISEVSEISGRKGGRKVRKA